MNILYSFHIIIYIILLYNNVVYGNSSEYIPSMTTSLINNDEEFIFLYNSLYGFESASDGNDIISTSIPFVTYNTNRPLSKEYAYKLCRSQQHKLLHPKKIDRIKFYDYIMEFDDNATLPNVDIEYIYIYTCIHNNPVLLSMKFELFTYYYSLDYRTNKWTNYTLRYDERPKKLRDDNGIDYYEKTSHGSLSDLYSRNFEKYKDEEKELVKDICNDHKCQKVDMDDDKFEIYMKEPKLIRAHYLYISRYKTNPKTKSFVYHIDFSDRYLIKNPRKIDSIKFYDYIMEFDDNAILPTVDVDYIYIFTCRHNNPLLISMYGSSKMHLFYLDYKTNKWTNYKIRYDEALTEVTDENDIICYTASNPNDFSPIDNRYEPVELAKERCNRNTCIYNPRSGEDCLEIQLK